MADAALDKLQIDILASGTSAAEGIERLATAVRNLRSAVGRGGSGLNGLATALKAVNAAVNGVDTGKIEGAASALSALGNALQSARGASTHTPKAMVEGYAKMESSVRKAQEAVHELNNALNTPTSNKSTGTREAQRAAEELGETAEKSAEKAEKAQTHSAKTATASWRTAASNITKVVSGLFRYFGIAKRLMVAPFQLAAKAAVSAGEKIKDLAVRGLTAPLRGISTMFNKVTGFIKAIGRIALYRAIRSAIKALTQGLQEGMQNLYQWSLLMDRTFANSMDSVATSMLYLKNGFASMFSPLINYAAPIIEEITNRLVDFFNAVQQIFAALTGASTWTKAVRVQKQYAEAVTDTGNAAEKAMHQLMAFDELNVINSPSATGAGSPKTDIPDYGSMFTTETVDTGLANWVEEIKGFFERGEFYELGQYVGEKLNGLINQWNSYDDGFNFGTNIRHVLQTLNGFLETFEFYNLGAKAGDWIAGILDGITPEEIARTLADLFNAAVSTANGLADKLIEKNVPAKIGQALGTAFANFDWQGLANLSKKILAGIVSIVNSAAESFISNGGPQKLVAAAQEIGKAIGEAFATADWASITEIVTSIVTGIGVMFSNAIKSFVSNGGPTKLRNAIGEIGKAIGTTFANLPGKDLVEIFNSIAGGLVDMLKKGIQAFKDGDGWTQIKDFFQGLDWGDLFTLAGLVATLKFGVPIIEGLTKAVIEAAVMRRILGGAVAGAAAGGIASVAGMAAAAAAVGIALTIPVVIGFHILGWDDRDFGQELDAKVTEFCDNVRAKFADALGQPGAENPLLAAVTSWISEIDKKLADWNPFKIITEFLTGEEYVLNDEGKYVPKSSQSTEDTPRSGIHSMSGRPTSDVVEDLAPEVKNVGETLEDILDILSGDNGLMFGGNTKFKGGGMGGGINRLIRNMVDVGGLDQAYMVKFLKDMERTIENSEVPSKYSHMMAVAAHEAIDAIEQSNIPGVMDNEATRSIAQFSSKDYAGTGRTAGNAIKQGVNSSDIPGTAKEIGNKVIAKYNEADYYGGGRTSGETLAAGTRSSSIMSVGQEAVNAVVAAFNSAAGALYNAGANGGAQMGNGFKATFAKNARTTIELQGAGVNKTTAYIQVMASGGYTQGSLFLAGEVAGQAEMVGSINGRTGVASGREITGIGDAVRAAGAEEAALLRQQNQLLQAILMKDPFGTPNSAAGRWIAQSSQAYKAVTG